MSKQINIGGRLHSTEQGNVITGANEVLDDTKGKKQNIINSETDAELLRLDQSKQNNLTFDNTPTENSTNPVTSGGVYAANITLHELIEAILVLIPSAASALNQLADKAFVNSSVSTATATFRGTYNVVTDLELAYDATHEQIATKLGQVIATADNNDYAFVQVPVSATSTDIRRTERYKFNGTVWGYEYDLNTSGFTAAQWEAINSGITALLVSKLTNLPTAEVLATMFDAKQNVLTFDTEPTALSSNPVTSGGIYLAIQAVATALSDYETATDALIPSEATALNQLADKAYVLASILAATPAFKGQFTTLADLQAVVSPKAGDLGIVRTKDNDGKDVFTVYQYLSNAWNVYFSLSYHPQTKPATTGTTGDYPYNGMGRVELPMNVKEIGGVTANYLEQLMMPTSTGGNTIYVIKYDFVLGDDIEIPANCVLEFDGGSISGDGVSAETITGNNTQIKAADVAIFKNGIVIAGTWICPRIPSDWFSDVTSNNRLQQLINLSSNDFDNTIIVGGGTYVVSNPENAVAPLRLKSNTTFTILGSIQLTPNNFWNGYIINLENDVENITINGIGEIVGDYLRGHTDTGGEWGHCITLRHCKHITIEGITLRNAWGDGISVGLNGDQPTPSEDVIIRGCHIHSCRRLGISVEYADGCIIENCYIHNIYGTNPEACIDIECDNDTYVNNVIVKNNLLINKKGVQSSATDQKHSSITIENNTVRFSRYYGINVDTGDSVVVRNNSITNVGMDETNPDDNDTGIKTFNVTIEYTPQANNKVTIDGVDYYYKEINVSYNELYLLDTTHCVLINEELTALYNDPNNHFFGKKIYIASTSTGTYTSAYKIEYNRFAISNSNRGTVIDGNYATSNSGGEALRGKYIFIESAAMTKAVICNNRFLRIYGASSTSYGIIAENAFAYSNFFDNTYSILKNCVFSNNKLGSRVLFANNSKIVNNELKLGDGGSIIGLNIESGMVEVINNTIDLFGSLTQDFASVSGENTKLIMKGNTISFVPTHGYILTQVDGLPGKKIVFEDNILDYSASIERNFLDSYLSISIPVKRGTTTGLNNLGLNAQYAGVEAYDTTLNKKVMWNGSAWVNVDGSALS